MKMCCGSVTVQFRVKFFIFAVHFNSFRVEVNGAVKILPVVFIVTLILINLCNCYKEENQLILGVSNFRLNKNGKLWLFCVQNFQIALSLKFTTAAATYTILVHKILNSLNTTA